jgi:hypothetical protein
VCQAFDFYLVASSPLPPPVKLTLLRSQKDISIAKKTQKNVLAKERLRGLHERVPDAYQRRRRRCRRRRCARETRIIPELSREFRDDAAVADLVDVVVVIRLLRCDKKNPNLESFLNKIKVLTFLYFEAFYFLKKLFLKLLLFPCKSTFTTKNSIFIEEFILKAFEHTFLSGKLFLKLIFVVKNAFKLCFFIV